MANQALNRRLLLEQGWGPIVAQLNLREDAKEWLTRGMAEFSIDEAWERTHSGWLLIDIANLLIEQEKLLILAAFEAVEAAAQFVSKELCDWVAIERRSAIEAPGSDWCTPRGMGSVLASFGVTDLDRGDKSVWDSLTPEQCWRYLAVEALSAMHVTISHRQADIFDAPIVGVRNAVEFAAESIQRRLELHNGLSKLSAAKEAHMQVTAKLRTVLSFELLTAPALSFTTKTNRMAS